MSTSIPHQGQLESPSDTSRRFPKGVRSAEFVIGRSHPSIARLSAVSLPYTPTWEEIHWRDTDLLRPRQEKSARISCSVADEDTSSRSAIFKFAAIRLECRSLRRCISYNL
ncbi:hypothetical protein TNCV_2186001 [Trichonephila clavipes]|nr:hypothetical protein TNCV_2186001 [Trichonephila clavipes]